jgi:hypothetical protein
MMTRSFRRTTVPELASLTRGLTPRWGDGQPDSTASIVTIPDCATLCDWVDGSSMTNRRAKWVREGHTENLTWCIGVYNILVSSIGVRGARTAASPWVVSHNRPASIALGMRRLCAHIMMGARQLRLRLRGKNGSRAIDISSNLPMDTVCTVVKTESSSYSALAMGRGKRTTYPLLLTEHSSHAPRQTIFGDPPLSARPSHLSLH